MRLSNKSTFSLVSLVVLIALGLVFGVTSVMAHPHIDDPDTPNVDESDADHVADDHPMATITLIPANADAFTEKSVDADDAVVQLLNSAGSAFAELRPSDSTVDPPINQDFTSIFKLLIEFNKDLTTGSSLAADELALTALDKSGVSVGDQLTKGGPSRVQYDHDNNADTSDTDHPRRFEVEITVPAALYAELPIRVFASMNADAVLSVTSVNPNSGETIPELGNPRSLPADAKFSIVAELPPPPAGPDTTPPELESITAGGDVAGTQADNGSFKITVVFDSPLHASALTGENANTVFSVTNGTITDIITTDNKAFTVEILPDPGDAVVVVKYNEGSVRDVAGNRNTDTETVAYLDLTPRAEVEQITLTPTAPTRVGGGDEITVTLTPLDGTIESLSSDNFLVTEAVGSDTISLMPILAETEATDDDAWTLTVTTSLQHNDEVDITEDSTVTITIKPGSLHLLALASAVSVTVDRTGPAVMFTEPSQSVKPNEAATVTIAVSGADPLETLELADISVIQTAEDGTASVLSHTFNSSTGMVVFTPTAEGTVVVTVEADAVVDEFGNMNSETVSDEIQISIEEIDTTAPSVTIGTPVAQNDGSIVFTFTFTEAVTFTHEHIDVTNAMTLTTANLLQSTTNARMYTLTVTPMDAADDVTAELIGGVVKDSDDNAALSASKTYTPPVMVETISVPAGGYMIITHANAAPDALPSALSADSVSVYSPMVDLENLLYTGGTIDVFVETTSDADDADTTPKVVINEVMWGVDEGQVGNPGYTKHQWIELYNTSADVDATALIRFRVSATPPSREDLPVGDATFKFKDRLSNVVRIGATTGWRLSKGQSGNSAEGSLKEFISMYRNRQDRDGWNHGHWTESDLLSHVNHRGTPGAKNTRDQVAVGTRTTPRRYTPPKDSVIINEVYNDSTDDFDWIELRFLKDTNIRNWTLSYATADFTEVEIMRFPNSNRTIKAGTILLIVNKDPRETKLAAGQDITLGDNNQARGAGTHKYWNPSNGNSGSSSYLDIPDYRDGDFLLILRKATGHNNANGGWQRFRSGDRIHDVVGTGTFVKQTLEADTLEYETHTANRDAGRPNGYIWNTRVWPLNDQNVRDYHRDHDSLLQNDRKLANGKVLARSGERDGWKKDGIYFPRNRGGHGYDRGVVADGTPGYDNDIRKNKHTDLAGGRVVVSELMLTTDSGRYPQWIELHNTSMTHTVDLHADSDGNGSRRGWSIKVENHRSGSWDGRRRDKLNVEVKFRDLGVQYIQPNQTILITADKVRNSASETRHHFPDHRVASIWGTGAKGVFKMENRRDIFLNAEGGFLLQIVDGSNQVSDAVGNLDGKGPDIFNTENVDFDDPYSWNWPTDMMGNRRTSLIRKYDDREPRLGTPDRTVEGSMRGAPAPLGTAVGGGEKGMMYSWVHAADTKMARAQITYYGSEDDYGTPGHTTSTPLPVSLSYFRPTLENGEVVIRWTTESELDNAGFNILRSDSWNGEFKQVNSELVQGAGTTGERTTYKWIDESAKPGVIYYYQIEDVSFAGEHQTLTTTKLKGLISAKNKLTTLWGGLKEVQ